MTGAVIPSKTVTHGPILKKNDDGSFSAVMSQTPMGSWVALADYERLERRIAQSCHDARSDPEFGGCPLADETSPDAEDAARYRWLRTRLATTIVHRFNPEETDLRPEKVDALVDSRRHLKTSADDPAPEKNHG